MASEITKISDNNVNLYQTMEALVEKYLSSLDVKEKSKTTYRKSLKRFIQYIDQQGITRKLTRTDLLDYKQKLMEQYTACTVSTYLSAVRGLFTYLEAERINPNIARSIKGAKPHKGFKKDALTVNQVHSILNGIDRTTRKGKRDFAIVNLLVRTGLRTIEIERANIEDMRQQGGEILLHVQGKGRDSKDDFVILTESALDPIREYLSTRKKVKPKDPLFTSCSNRNKGKRLTTRSLRRIIKNSFLRVGIDSDRITAHSLRHTAVTLSLIGGASVQEAQTMARHSNINTTMIYAHNINRLKHAPERKVDSVLG
jgi:integrase/recombinase XerC/integrase/recombinase XerD